MFKKIAIAATLAILSSAAMAADQPYFYAGGDIGSSKPSDGDRETSYGGFGGYQINQYIAVEAGYRRLADHDYVGGNVKADQIHVSAVGTLPLSNGFNVFGRLGYNRVSFKVSEPGISFTDHEDRAVYGAGVGYSFSPTVMGRLEVLKPEAHITTLTASVAFRF